ncbi:hypothetical protein A4308_12240 [Enterobacter sp. ODB01]|nr:hypothetical protein A4308_12240 [Enterobacter sp. ODB01]
MIKVNKEIEIWLVKTVSNILCLLRLKGIIFLRELQKEITKLKGMRIKFKLIIVFLKKQTVHLKMVSNIYLHQIIVILFALLELVQN